MKLNLKNLEPAGFKSTALFARRLAGGLFYRKKSDRVEFVSTNHPEGLGVFQLTEAQMRKFETGKLSLVPPGCCNPSGGAQLENGRIVYAGAVRNLEHLEDIFSGVKL